MTIIKFSAFRGNILFASTLFLIVCTLTCFSGRVIAQQRISTNLYSIPSNSVQTEKISTGNLHIVALMVDFQPDENRFTSGNGTFNPDFLNSPDIIIDPLPHNRVHFQAHLEFVKNYFEQASKTQLTISYEVLPEIVTLSGEMAEYSPTGPDDSENYKLIHLFEEAWTLADQKSLLNPASYNNTTAFILFHAGSGRDFNFLGTTLNPTPQDIPSIYLSLNGMRSILGNSAYNGVEIANGTYTIQNSGILPETESRKGALFGEEFVLQLSINGLLTATIGNHIGLPDLFNTSEGTSGIGRFGLMDPEGFFAWFGLFPPDMSAWEKIYMDWESPVTYQTPGTLSLPSASLKQPLSIAKIPISEQEYYLVENRHRDADNNGITLTIQRNDGSSVQQTFTHTDIAFRPDDTDSLFSVLEAGVITNVSNFDWALPGGLDPNTDNTFNTADDRLLNGGILIWHIDETVIRANFDANSINSNYKRKGIRLIEADGAQDIGRSTGNTFLESVVGGFAFDFWWSGNDYTVITAAGRRIVNYTNRFDLTSTPASLDNDGNPTPFALINFSDNLPTASVELIANENTLPFKRLSGWDGLKTKSSSVTFDQTYPFVVQAIASGGDTTLFIPTQTALFAGKPGLPNSDMISYPLQIATPVLLSNPNSTQKLHLAYTPASGIYHYRNYQLDNELLPGIIDDDITLNTRPGLLTRRGNTIVIQQTDISYDLESESFGSHDADVTSSELNNRYALISNEQLSIVENGESRTLPLPVYNKNGRILIAPLILKNNRKALLLVTETEIFLIDEDEEKFNLLYQNEDGFFIPSLSQLNDNSLAISFVDHTTYTLQSINENGAVLNHLYFRPKSGSRYYGTPLIADFNGDDITDILVVSMDSLYHSLHIYSSDGTLMNGFPVTIGSAPKTDEQLIEPLIFGKNIFAISHDGILSSFHFRNLKDLQFSSVYGDNNGQQFSYSHPDLLPPITFGDQLLVKSEVYNWPNPANDITHLRYRTTESGSVTTSVLSQSGYLVWDKKTVTNGLTSEEIALDVSNWGSGIYYVRISFKNQNGKTDSKIYTMVIER